MAESSTQCANLALGHLGSLKEIANLDTENSQEARAMRRFYTQALDEMLRGFSWPFAMKTADLSLIEEDPTTEWAFSYAYPTDCLFLRRILGVARNDSKQSRIPFREAFSDDQQLIYTDEEDAVMEYTVRVSTVERWPVDFVKAFAFLLASYAAPSITAGDPLKLGDRAMVNHISALAVAKANSNNEECEEEPVDSEFVRARE